ncbi:KilA-N domain-containing protein [Agrobacterium sp. S2]|nr:KilA-N domain-containing protein [Agrobacterium sp. S2]
MQSRLNTVRQAITPLSYNGHVITDKGDMLSLTDMWKANGSDPARQPSNWLASADAKRFIDALNVLEPGNSGVQTKKGGRGIGGSSYGHWQIGMAYAKYLDPNFHMWCNIQVRAVMEGKAAGAIPTGVLDQIRRTEGISKMLAHKVTGIEKSNADLQSEVARLRAEVQETSSGLRRYGVTARQIWEQFGLPALKCGTLWLGNRLMKMGAGMEFGQRADIGGKAVRLFDPDKAKHCMENGLHNTARSYVAERQGQGRLHLVQRE